MAAVAADAAHEPSDEKQQQQQQQPYVLTEEQKEDAGGPVGEAARKRKRVAFVGAEYIEYELAAPPAVRRCGVAGLRARTDADLAVEWRARQRNAESGAEAEEQAEEAEEEEEESVDAATLRVRLQSEYEREMREALADRGFPCLDAALVPLRVQFRASELLVAWSLVAPTTASSPLDASASLDVQRKRLELCRKQVFGPVVDGYAFGRRFFSIDSFLSLLELEELVALAEAHAIDVPALPPRVAAKIKVTDRELISTYSPTGIGKPLKMLTFRELVEEAYARGILMGEDERDAKNKKSKRAWVDALRPALHAEMRAFKIREAHTELIHEFLAAALETKMRALRMDTIAALVKNDLRDHPEPSSDASDGGNTASPSGEDMAAVRQYFRELMRWYDAQPPAAPPAAASPCSSPSSSPAPGVSSAPSSPPQPSPLAVPLEPMSPTV